jgi:hypothetical protein
MKRNLRFSVIAGCLAACLLSVAMFTGVEVVELRFLAAERFPSHLVDDLVVAFVLIIGGLSLDVVLGRAQHRMVIREHRLASAVREARYETEVREQRLRVLQATMQTAQDIVDNFLNNMQVLRSEAQEGDLSFASCVVFDELTQRAAADLRALGGFDLVSEKQLAVGVAFSFKRESNKRKKASYRRGASVTRVPLNHDPRKTEFNLSASKIRELSGVLHALSN